MTETLATPQPEVQKNRTFGELLTSDLRALPVVIGLVALWIFFATQSDVFLTARNLSNLFVQSTVVGIMALGLMFVLLVKEIDLSVAAINGVTAVLMAKLVVEFSFSPWISIPIAVVVGAAIGSMSARWVTFVGVPSFVVTTDLEDKLALKEKKVKAAPVEEVVEEAPVEAEVTEEAEAVEENTEEAKE